MLYAFTINLNSHRVKIDLTFVGKKIEIYNK